VTGASWLIKLVNKSKGPCVIEGFPSVQPLVGKALVSRTLRTLAGPLGGVRTAAAPPIVLLTPGEVASALIEPGSNGADGLPGSCTADHLAIELPVAGALAELPLRSSACNLQVHPVVAGPSGSDR
jgi:hypothetical protein